MRLPDSSEFWRGAPFWIPMPAHCVRGSESEDSRDQRPKQQSPELFRRDDPHHPKTDVHITITGKVAAAERRARGVLSEVPRAATQHTANFSANVCIIRVSVLVQTPLPNVATHIQNPKRRCTIREQSH